MLEIKIDTDKKCERCKKPGATESGLCLACIVKGIKKGEFDHIIKSMRDVVKSAVKITKPNEKAEDD